MAAETRLVRDKCLMTAAGPGEREIAVAERQDPVTEAEAAR
jgi:hypothetical protein